MNAGKILLGVLAGAAIGATLGILLAPEKGKSTRKRMLQKKDHYIDALEEKFNDFIAGITRKTDHAMEKATEITDKAKAGI